MQPNNPSIAYNTTFFLLQLVPASERKPIFIVRLMFN